MPQTPHTERHFSGSDRGRDIVIGMSDRLTVRFALVAALSSVVNTTVIFLAAGLDEVGAGSIAMGSAVAAQCGITSGRRVRPSCPPSGEHNDPRSLSKG